MTIEISTTNMKNHYANALNATADRMTFAADRMRAKANSIAEAMAMESLVTEESVEMMVNEEVRMNTNMNMNVNENANNTMEPKEIKKNALDVPRLNVLGLITCVLMGLGMFLPFFDMAFLGMGESFTLFDAEGYESFGMILFAIIGLTGLLLLALQGKETMFLTILSGIAVFVVTQMAFAEINSGYYYGGFSYPGKGYMVLRYASILLVISGPIWSFLKKRGGANE